MMNFFTPVLGNDLAQPKALVTHARLKEAVAYDAATGVFTRNSNGKRIEHVTSGGYHRVTIDGRSYSAARLAWFYVYGVWPPFTVDHKNRCRLDNRIENLRLATPKQQGANRAYKNAIGVKNVRLKDNRYAVSFTRNGVARDFGYYTDLKTAVAVRNRVARELYGDFATVEQLPKSPAVSEILSVKQRSSAIGVKNVRFRNGVYEAYINRDRRYHYLGTFKSLHAAIAARDAALEKHPSTRIKPNYAEAEIRSAAIENFRSN